ncbi:MAG: DMT family transporter [Alphaproteobacteria bacterium]|nr:DMT family transporter [Alphaproteobacteria bacterium]MBU1281146.1 DMT family transporter [Alphaproteobacteria bacterium]MBU1573322.1 DMT family transporter [Alphaproteobacteria bacterium]MBU1830529.1 DMT family transporter [Alphaproteobacteria bacterium]MBU2079058.1 DMT family transporter [Alphaproteobacteria bacterium]
MIQNRPPDHPVFGLLLMVGFCAIAPLIDVSAKLASVAHPAAQITVGRFVVQALILVPLSGIMGLSWQIGRRDWGLIALRALFTLGATFAFVGAVSVMPLADALAVTYVEPFVILLLGWMIFHEQIGPRRIMAAVVGFAGALIVVQPGLVTFGVVALLPFAAGVLFACYMLVTRALRHHTPVLLQAATAVVSVLMALPILVYFDGKGGMFDPVMPEGIMWVWLISVGLAATLSHQLLTLALRLAPSATLAPLSYLELAFSTLAGLVVFGDFPNLTVWIGIAVIVASGLYLIHRERMHAQKPPVVAGPTAS